MGPAALELRDGMFALLWLLRLCAPSTSAGSRKPRSRAMMLDSDPRGVHSANASPEGRASKEGATATKCNQSHDTSRNKATHGRVEARR